MRREHFRITAVLLLLGGIALSGVSLQRADSQQASSQAALKARGQYLVDRVGMCGDCHTPRLANGKWNMRRYLQGTALDIKPVKPMPNWESHAANITAAGLKDDSVSQVATWLRGKTDVDGQPIPLFRPPMPAFRMSAADAQAVATYLKSVRPK